MQPWCIRFGRERNAKKNETLIVKIQQAANNTISSSTWHFFFKNQPTKKTKTRGENWRSYYRCTWYTYHVKDALDNHEQTGGGAGCKRPRQRGTDASFTCVLLRSCRDVRRPRHLPNAKTAAIFQPHSSSWGSCRWDHEKTFIVFRRSVDLGGSMPAEYWYLPRVSYIYVQKFHSTSSLLFILTWGGVWCRFLVLLLSIPP